MKRKKYLFNSFGNSFGNSFENLPIELQREIYLQNTEYYQQEVANKLIEYHKIYAVYNLSVENLKNVRHPQGRMVYLIKIVENKNKQFSKSETNKAKKELETVYKPAVLQEKKSIERFKKELEKIKKEYEDSKKKYYYFYNKLKKLK